MALSSFNQCYI